MTRTHHLLVVEDTDEDFETVTDAARRASIPNLIRRTATGGECLALLRASAQNSTALPAFVLLDLNTPGDDGRHALTHLKKDSQLSAIPIIVLSTSANPRDVAYCYANGANAYHIKPVNHVMHLQMLQGIFTYWLGSALLPTERPLERR
ncbi:MAG: response regulator receiver protein [Polaromonas sp.]|jgi:CheY-like chemotaxis protein|nr:response regulator receiver protein [Polaromonas sp.]